MGRRFISTRRWAIERNSATPHPPAAAFYLDTAAIDMGICGCCDAPEFPEDPEPLAEEQTGPGIALVEAGQPSSLVVRHAETLKQGQPAPLTLSSHPGLAVVPRTNVAGAGAKGLGLTSTALALGPAHLAITVRLLGGSSSVLQRPEDERVLQIPSQVTDSVLREGVEELCLVRHLRTSNHSRGATAAAGTKWVLHSNGTLSIQGGNPRLVLGVCQKPKLVLVPLASRRVCSFEYGALLQDGQPAPLTLAAPSQRLAVVQTLPPCPPVAFGQYKWEYVHLGMETEAEEPLVLRLSGKYLVREAGPQDQTRKALDVRQWDYREGARVSLVSCTVAPVTFQSGGGRDWQVNTNQTVSPCLAPALAIGLSFIPQADYGSQKPVDSHADGTRL